MMKTQRALLVALAFAFLAAPGLAQSSWLEKLANFFQSGNTRTSFSSLKELAQQNAKRPEISKDLLRNEIKARMSRVPEFVAIQEIAARHGARVWLFGGTAAAWAHYVRWDLLREAGDASLQQDRFDYDYTNIFRSMQDLDLVVDGSPETLGKIESEIRGRFAYFTGNKSMWELRLLKSGYGDKEALLDNPDFLNQHTDSNSTGLIEFTESAEPTIRDVRDWNTKLDNAFFSDVYEGKLHFYFSEAHRRTSRFRQGLNPPIFSAIRYLTKAFQYELEILPEDWKKIEQIVTGFSRARDLKNAYCRGWIERNGKKLFQHAVNIEYAWDVTELLGLRRKLVAMGDKNAVDSLAWWMDKEPLRSKPVGRGFGKTARELGITTVAHETTDILAYESITRAHSGDPNVFISRQDRIGEAAAYGDGFYTMIGREGLRSTGITIRFEIDPDARAGTDFALVDVLVLIRNKNAFRVIPESVSVDPESYFLEIAGGGVKFANADRAILEKLRRRVKYRTSLLDEEELGRIGKRVLESAISGAVPFAALQEWFLFARGAPKEEVLLGFIDFVAGELSRQKALPPEFSVLMRIKDLDPALFEHASIREKLEKRIYMMISPLYKNRHFELAMRLKSGDVFAMPENKFILEHAKDVEFIEAMTYLTYEKTYSFFEEEMDGRLVSIFASYSEFWAKQPNSSKLMSYFIAKDRPVYYPRGEKGPANHWLMRTILAEKAWAEHPDALLFLQLAVENYGPTHETDRGLDEEFESRIFRKPYWQKPELIAFCGGHPSYSCIRKALAEGKTMVPLSQVPAKPSCSGYLKK